MKKFISTILLCAMLLCSFAGCGTEAPAHDTFVSAVSSSAQKYADFLNDRMDGYSENVLICDAADSAKYGIDLSDFRPGGYTIKSVDGATVIAGADDAGLDAAVRYFAKYADGSPMDVTEGEGYKVKSIKIDGHDISEYTVYVPTDIPDGAYAENLDYAADVLIKYVAEACGVTLKKAGLTEGRQIIFGYDRETYGEEAFNISVEDGNVRITCGIVRGPLYGAYGFLEECIGYRFLTRGVVYLYEAECISLENGFSHTEGTETPFKWRDTYTNIDAKTHLYPPGALTSAYSESVIALHNTGTWTQKWINNPKYGYGEGPDRNHSAYALIPSIPDLDTPCFSDPDIFDECLENLYIYIESLLAQGYEWGTTMPKISVSQNDTGSWCNCSDCMKLISDYGAYSATLIDFIARLSEELEKDYPEIEFWMLAYHTSTTKPPVGMEIPDNLTICFCHYLACNNHSVEGYDCDGYVAELGVHFRNWLTITDNVDVWYYANHFNYSLSPAANIYQMYYDINYYARCGVTGFFCQNEETTLGFDDLSSYLSAQMLWDPFMTIEEYQAHIEEFCRIFYGDGYNLICDYIKDMEEAGNRNGCWCALSDAPFCIYNFDFMTANFDYFVYLFETAIEMANTAEQEARLKRLSCHMYFLCISASYDDVMTKGSDEEKALLTERYQLLYDRLYEIRDVIMFGIFTDDKVPEVFDPTVHPLEWLTQHHNSWGDMMD